MNIRWYVVLAYILATLSLLYVYMGFWLPYDFMNEPVSDEGHARAIVSGCYDMANSSTSLAYLVTAVLLVIANIDYWRQKHIHLFWLSIGHVAVYNWLYFKLLEDIFIFKQKNGIWEGGFSVTYIAGAFIILLYIIIVLVNYSIIKHFRNQKIKTA